MQQLEKRPCDCDQKSVSRMTAVLTKTLVCPRLRDDHSGRLMEFQHKLVILSGCDMQVFLCKEGDVDWLI